MFWILLLKRKMFYLELVHFFKSLNISFLWNYNYNFSLFLSNKTTGLSQRHELNNGTNANGTPGELEFGKPENITNHATGMIDFFFREKYNNERKLFLKINYESIVQKLMISWCKNIGEWNIINIVKLLLNWKNKDQKIKMKIFNPLYTLIDNKNFI